MSRLGISALAVAVAAVAVIVVFLGGPREVLANPGVDEGKAAFARQLCGNCHGANAEGGYGPALAGRGVPAEGVLRQLRTPFRRMPSFRPNQVSDDDAASIAEFLSSLPAPAERGTARAVAAPGDSAVKVQWIEKGCAQCHGANPAGLVTNWAERGPLSLPELLNRKANGGRLMPSFREDQVSDAQEGEFHAFLMGMMTSSYPVSAGVTASRAGTETTFVVTVHNNSDENIFVEVKGVLPKGAKVVDSWAGSGRGFNSGKFDGTAMGWINTNVPAHKSMGPFVYIVDTGSEPAAGYAWIRYFNTDGQGGSYTSRVVTAAP